MLLLEPVYNHLAPFLLTLFRVMGLFVFAPALGSTMIPVRVRTLLAVVLALSIYPTIPPEQQAPISFDLLSLGIAVAAEATLGVTIGLLAAMPVYAAQLGGLVMGQQVGLGLANVYNPALDTNTDQLGQFMLYIALAIFLVLGGLDALFLATVRTFASVPLACFPLGLPPLALFIEILTSGFEMAIRIATPVLAILLLETIAVAFLMKTMPQLNIMSIGFALKIIAALLALAAATTAVDHAIHGHIRTVTADILHYAESPTDPVFVHPPDPFRLQDAPPGN